MENKNVENEIKTKRKLEKFIKNKSFLRGVVDEVFYGNKLEDDYISLKWNDIQVRIYRPELDIVPIYMSLENYIGKVCTFSILSLDEEAGIIYGSIKAVRAVYRDNTLKLLKDGKTIKAKVIAVNENGAKLIYNKTLLFMSNKDWGEKFATMLEYVPNGTVMKVKLNNLDKMGRIHVKPLKKFKENTDFDLSVLKPKDVLVGRIRSVKISCVYVKIAGGIDVMCPVPGEWFCPEPSDGEYVAIRLTQIHPEDKRLRGKIQGRLKMDEVSEELIKLENFTHLDKDTFEMVCDVDSSYVYGDIEKRSKENMYHGGY